MTITIQNQNGRKDKSGKRLWGRDVFLDGRRVGVINSLATGWQYVPEGQRKGGDVFTSLPALIRSLEGEDHVS
jgi:hypothetical protein